MRKEKTNTMKLCLNILWILSILASVCLGFIFLISYYENRKLVIRKYSIDSDKIRKNKRYRIVHLSDLHNASFGTENEVLLHKVEQLKPDFILATGDFIVGKPGRDLSCAIHTLNHLSDICKVYFSLGNHELRTQLYPDVYGNMWEQFRNALNEKIVLLEDETVFVDNLAIHGLKLNPELYKRFRKTPMEEGYLESRFGKCQEGYFHVFMAHNPDYFDEYVKWGADLVCSGHIHGGLIRIPVLGGLLSPMIRFFPKYDKGIFKKNKKYMILSGGLGNHTYKIRVNNLPEIVLITLESASN